MNPSFAPLWAVLASLLWGLSYALDEKILKTISFVHVLALNAVIALLFTVPILLFRGEWSAVVGMPAKTLGLIVISSVLTVAAGACIFLGIKNLGASAASVIEISYPFFVTLFCVLLWKERLTPSFFIGAAFIFCGSVIVARSRG